MAEFDPANSALAARLLNMIDARNDGTATEETYQSAAQFVSAFLSDFCHLHIDTTSKYCQTVAAAPHAAMPLLHILLNAIAEGMMHAQGLLHSKSMLNGCPTMLPTSTSQLLTMCRSHVLQVSNWHKSVKKGGVEFRSQYYNTEIADGPKFVDYAMGLWVADGGSSLWKSGNESYRFADQLRVFICQQKNPQVSSIGSLSETRKGNTHDSEQCSCRTYI